MASVDVIAVVTSRPDLLGTLRRARPQLLILDAALPGGGLEAVAEVMSNHALPIAVLCPPSSAATGQAVAAGAVEVWDERLLPDLVARCQVLSKVAVMSRSGRPAASSRPARPVGGAPAPPTRTRPIVIAVGASAGGPTALTSLLAGLTGLAAPVLIVQHIDHDFVQSLVNQLQIRSALPVEIAKAGRIVGGRVYVAPTGRHIQLRPDLHLELTAEPTALHVPSVDVLFRSVAECRDTLGVGVLLTGMGRDGAEGLRLMRLQGDRTLAQDEESSAVYGMPGAAVECGAPEEVLPLDRIAGRILSLARVGTAVNSR